MLCDYKAKKAACGCLKRCLYVPVNGAEKFGKDCEQRQGRHTARPTTHSQTLHNKTSSCPSARPPTRTLFPTHYKRYACVHRLVDPTLSRPQLTLSSAASWYTANTPPPPQQIYNHGRRRCKQHAHLQAGACRRRWYWKGVCIR